jgi:hypothetical protein
MLSRRHFLHLAGIAPFALSGCTMDQQQAGAADGSAGAKQPNITILFADDLRHTQLFDLQADPWEMKNLADDPNFKSHWDRLGELLQSSRRKYDDPTL